MWSYLRLDLRELQNFYGRAVDPKHDAASPDGFAVGLVNSLVQDPDRQSFLLVFESREDPERKSDLPNSQLR